ncbi:TPA: restriction endonuclease subunit S [Escherichia coli]|uniref:restriction endonuclease subunit S n=2 Tax=Escherichia coli TaxID=562 RepID=UPI001372E039|nr:restriction endonuclease subunit S [Escherichia coli]ELG5993321.1 restriction endonuclease subunit S [Escherichia coli]ELZ1080706.1 restriction endonuclease subunit S [Escherichia coli]NAU00339.1 restriction endonuclease subunit S [Escherichia coli]HAW5875443.1 restriction endonuclease subunit S [Escherichia coli]
MSELSYLEKLLDGVKVEWLPLGEITKYEQPTKYLVKAKDYHDTYTIPVLTAGKTFILGYTNETHGIYQASKAPVIIFDDFTTANKWVDFDFKAKSSAMKMVTSCDDNKTLLKYVYYWLNTLPSEFAEGDHKRQWISNYSQKKIPIPCPDNPEKSLAIQSEIVRILDKFTALTAELTAELNMRKKQYNYYRDQLLSFKEGEVEWKALGEIGEVRMCKRILKSQTSSEGEIPFYKIGTFGKEPDSYISRKLFNEFKEKYSYPKVGEVLISASGTIGRTVIFDGRESYFQDSNIVWIENNEKIVLNKYLFYFYKIAKWGISEGGTIKRLYNDNLRKLTIPVPFPDSPERSLVEQQKIVKLLDKFDALTNSITEGLPREIELRQKQYEYYRDLLFSFPKPDTVSN